MKSRINLSFAKLLQALRTDELNAALFSSSNKRMLGQFLQDGVLDFRLIGNQKRKIFCADWSNLIRYLQNKFEISSLDDYVVYLEQEDTQRSDAVKAVSDSKFRKTKVFQGFLLNSYQDILCELDGQPILVRKVRGAYTFISAFTHFKIPNDVTVVVVEGHENFREIERQRYLFNGLKPLFVWRYQNSAAVAEWLRMIPNPYLHFGDCDPKGIHIFLAEFRKKIGGERGEFLVPPDLESMMIQHGEKQLYEKQKNYIPLIRSHGLSDAVSGVVELIIKHKKGLAQEVFIREAGGTKSKTS